MNKKIFHALFLTALVTMVAAAAISATVFYFSYSERVMDDLAAELSYLKIAYDDDPESIAHATMSFGRRLTVISSDGSVAYDSVASEDAMENHLDRPEVKEAITAGFGTDRRESGTLLTAYYYAAERMADGTILRLSVSGDNIFSFVMGMMLPMALLLLVLLVILSLIAARIAKGITEPINSIDLSNPEAENSYEELSPLLFRIAKQQALIKQQVEAAERKSHEFAIIIDNMSEGLAVIDTNARILSVNRAAWMLFDAAEVKIGDSILAINREEIFSSIVDDALSGKRSEAIEETRTRVLQLIASPVFEDDKVSGAVVIMIDITEKSEREKLRREFTANVSHELKTPLQSISGYAELLKNGGLSPETAADFGNEIYSESQRLIALVHDIIRLSKLDENDAEEINESVSLADIAEDVADRLAKKAKAMNVKIQVIRDDDGVINGAEALLDEMIFNLLDNAVIYNRKGGTAIVRIFRDGNDTVLSVKDTGIGIPDSDQDRVFERFYRVDKSRSKATGGTGLGLSIVRHAALYHHATISLDSKLGIGTEITIRFPEM